MTPFIRISALLLCTAIAPAAAATSYEDKYLDANGVIDGADLGIMLSSWGSCP